MDQALSPREPREMSRGSMEGSGQGLVELLSAYNTQQNNNNNNGLGCAESLIVLNWTILAQLKVISRVVKVLNTK